MASHRLSSWYMMPSPQISLQPPTSNEADLSFDEVAKHFTVPIAEAAAILGVGTINLKQICKENGIARWPYRKILAGKTVEDIKREAVREKALVEEMAKRTMPQHGSVPNQVMTSGTPTLASQFSATRGGASSGTVRWQPGQGYVVHQNPMRSLHIDHRLQAQQQSHMRVTVPTFLDECKHGFPDKGLSVVSSRWWGSVEPDNEEGDGDTAKKVHASDASNFVDSKSAESINGESQIFGSKGSSRILNKEERVLDNSIPASILTRTRKKAVDGGRRALGLAVTRGYGAYKLAEKDEALLRTIFEDSLPGLWQVSMSS